MIELTFTPLTDDLAKLSDASRGSIAVTDFDLVKRMAHAFMLRDKGDPALMQTAEATEAEAYDLLEKRWQERLERNRHNAYTAILSAAKDDTAGYFAARLALELPDGLRLSSTEILHVLDMAEKRLMERGMWKGTIDSFDAYVVGGHIACPKNVEAILAVDVCGSPLTVRSVFFEYQENGPGGGCCASGSRLVDEGEQYDPVEGASRRHYTLRACDTEEQLMTFVAKLRWQKKGPADRMTIRNFEAIRLMSAAILSERAEKWKEAMAGQQMAIEILDKELAEYLSGIVHTIPQQNGYLGVSDLGTPL